MLAPLLGCLAPALREPAPPPPVDEPAGVPIEDEVQLAGAITLADFQTPDQANCFHLVSADGEVPQPTTSPLPETADPTQRCLVAPFNAPDQQLELDVASLSTTPAPTDWHKFGVLLYRLHAQGESANLTLILEAGPEGRQVWSEPVHAHAGWNHFQLDLDTIARQIDLSRVQRLSWRSAGPGAVTIHLDDLRLANRTRWLLGESAEPGELSAYARGGWLHVASVGRYELVFHDGLIAGWFADSPGNLTVGSGLGPWPVPLPAGWAAQEQPSIPADIRASSDADQVRDWRRQQRLLEATPLRVVVEGRHSPVAAGGTSSVTSERSWRYVVYADGRVCVRTSYHPDAEVNVRTVVGQVVALSGRAEFRLAEPPAVDPYRPPAAYMLLTRPGEQGADLLWVPAQPETFAQSRVLREETPPTLLALTGDLTGTPSVEAASALFIWPPNLDDAAAAEPLAAGYQRPVALTPLAGELVRDAPGDLNGDGFNEAEGCYELALRRGVLRFVFDPGDLPRETPVFRVQGSAGHRCWIYADGQALKEEQRDAAGRLMFTLPGTIRVARNVEVHARTTPPSP
ncbi:MAG: hypothetical protein PVJ57_10025 [Phycisphaerae bacterium]|jgi:hypothetical protein